MNKLSYPNPIFIRESSEYLDGGWLFSYDGQNWQEINVPFSPESVLSKIGNIDFIRTCYYKTCFSAKNGDLRTYINFGAVDYIAVIRVNGCFVGTHTGGYTPFSFDITDFLKTGGNELLIEVLDETKNKQAHGKQSFTRLSSGCFYTRTTGIWQSVWLEYAPEYKIEQFYFYPDIDASSVDVDLITGGEGDYSIEVFLDNKLVGQDRGRIKYRKRIKIALSEKRLWSLGSGNLYDVEITFDKDIVKSYFGLRKVEYKGYNFYINDEKVFQKLVLDQGFYTDGVITAPSFDSLEKDIDLALALGFNGSRLHQKVFDPKMLYLCDIKGYMVWGEMPSWGVDYSSMKHFPQFISELGEELQRDFNHPSIVVWCPLNEVWGSLTTHDQKRDIRFIDGVYNFVKSIDDTRPVIDVSGGHHGHETDIYDFHCYESIETLKKVFADLDENDKIEVAFLDCEGEESHYKKGTPVIISECGGGVLNSGENDEDVFGYRDEKNDTETFVDNYRKLISVIAGCKKISGFCYTQLYDVEQEKNGFYNYDRSQKLSDEQMLEIKKINTELIK